MVKIETQEVFTTAINDVEAAVKDKIFTIGENMSIRRFAVVEGNLATYIHGKGTIGVIVKMDDSAAAGNAAFAEAAKNVALQIAAASPAVTDSTDASHTAGRISKGFSQPQAARTPATVVGSS